MNDHRIKTPVRKDIQALRAIAVTFVILNHFWPARMTGGFIGVDVFFVVSGFLITSHLLRDLAAKGKLNLKAFYIRRARRLLPAAYFVTLVTLAATVIFLPVSRWIDTAVQSFAASAYVLNWVLAAKSINYSASNELATPFQHFWSLSVEEQFYLCWPILLWLVYLLARRQSHAVAWFFGGFLAFAIISTYAISIQSTLTMPSQAYFVTQNRVWEFAMGGVLALIDGKRKSAWVENAWTTGALQLSGVAMLLISAFTFSPATQFPGPWAAIPVVGTALIIWAGPTTPRYSVMTALTTRFVQFLGNISYSLYLWHWPLLVILPFVIDRPLNSIDKILTIAIAIGLAALSKTFIEDKARARLFPNVQPGRFLIGVLGSVLIFGLLSSGVVFGALKIAGAADRAFQDSVASQCFGAKALMLKNCGDPFASPTVMPSEDSQTPWFDDPGCAQSDAEVVLGEEHLLTVCDFSTASTSPTVWLVGDSHAEHWKAAIIDLAKRENWKLKISAVGGCPLIALPRVSYLDGPPDPEAFQRRCLAWSHKINETIMSEKPDVIIASSFSYAEHVDDGTARSQAAQYADATRDLIELWGASGAAIVPIRDVPRPLGRATRDCLTQNPSDTAPCNNPQAEALVPDPFFDGVVATNYELIFPADLSNLFCREAICHSAIGQVPVYYDDNHISRSYSLSLSDALVQTFSKALSVR